MSSRKSVAFPVVLCSLFAAAPVMAQAPEDETFGYIDGGVLVTVPLTSVPGSYGSWNVPGGVNFLGLGDTLKSFNNGDTGQVIVSAGFGFSY